MAEEENPLDALVARAERLRDSQGTRALEPWLPYTVLIPGAVAEGAELPSDEESEQDHDYAGWSSSLDDFGTAPVPEPLPAAGADFQVAPTGGFQIDPNADLPEWLRIQQQSGAIATPVSGTPYPPSSASPDASGSWTPGSLPEASVSDVPRAAGRVSIPPPADS